MAETLIGVEKCGTCMRGKVIDAQNLLVRECWGAPPTPCVVGGRAANGVANYSIEMLRPRVQASDDACGLYKRRTEASAPSLGPANARSL